MQSAILTFMEGVFLFYIHHNSKIKKILTNLFKGNNNNNNLSNWYKQIYIYIYIYIYIKKLNLPKNILKAL